MRAIQRMYKFFRYDIPYGTRNMIRFFPIIWQYRPWDYCYNLMLLRESLQQLHRAIDTGLEIDETRIPKVKAIQRALTILDHVVDDEYIELAEKEIGVLSQRDRWFRFQPCKADKKLLHLEDRRSTEEQQHDKAVFEYTRQLEEQEWSELWRIVVGSDNIPGSDMRSWWD